MLRHPITLAFILLNGSLLMTISKISLKDLSNIYFSNNQINTTAYHIYQSSGNNEIKTKASHHINTSADEYLPVKNKTGNTIYFTGMDRTGFFDFKIDFTKAKNAGGEDIYFSELSNGVWSDARPLTELNTNSHESVTFVNDKGNLLITGNYPENIGPSNSNDNGSNTTDIFYAVKNGSGYKIIHLPEPVNSIYNEFDAVADDKNSFILFASDRPGGVGEYHKKGWLWNDNKWGNSDIYVSLKIEEEWRKPINLGKKVNTIGAERSPWLSDDQLTLYLSSNGHKTTKDLDVFYFTRKNKNDWQNWEGPFPLKNINTNNDDWGYKIYKDQTAVFSQNKAFDYEITQKTRSGDAGFRETNFRSGYQLIGAQSASLNKNYNTDIFFIYPNNKPQFSLSEILFEFNRYEIKGSYTKIIENLADYCKLNQDKKITIIGYTDNTGNQDYNIKLSLNRAESIKKELVKLDVSNIIECKGLGAANPITPNLTENDKKKNRRIEVFFK